MITSTQQNPQVVTYNKPAQMTLGQTSPQLLNSNVFQPAPVYKSVINTNPVVSTNIPIQSIEKAKKSLPLEENQQAKKLCCPDKEKCILNVLRQAICILPLILAIFALVMTSILIHKHINKSATLEDSRQLLNFVAHNLNGKPFFDIKVQADNQNCDASAGWSDIILGQFPATQAGTVCDDGTLHDKIYYYLRPRFSFKCDINDGTAAQEMKLYPATNNIDGALVHVCVKYNKVYIPISNGACPDPKNQKKTENLNFCIAQGETDPYNMVVPAANSPVTNINARNITIGGIEFTFYTDAKLATVTPIAGFEIEPGVKCWEQYTTAQFESKLAYPGLSVKPIGCIQQYGQAKNLFEDLKIPQNELKLYEKNKILPVVQGLPFYDQFIKQTDTLRLFAEKQIRVDHGKCPSVNLQAIQTVKQDSKGLDGWIHGLSITILIFAILVIITSVVFFILRKKLTKKNPVKLMYILAGIIVILALWGFIVYLVYNWRADSLENNVNTVSSQKSCFFDSQIVQSLDDLIGYGNLTAGTFGLLWKWLFWVSFSLAIIAGALIGYKIYKYGTPILQNPWVNDA